MNPIIRELGILLAKVGIRMLQNRGEAKQQATVLPQVLLCEISDAENSKKLAMAREAVDSLNISLRAAAKKQKKGAV